MSEFNEIRLVAAGNTYMTVQVQPDHMMSEAEEAMEILDRDGREWTRKNCNVSVDQEEGKWYLTYMRRI